MTLTFHRTKSYPYALAIYNLWISMGQEVRMSYLPDGVYFVRAFIK